MLEMQIETLAFGGDGLGRHQGQAVFVPLTTPGDLIRCRITERKKHYLRAELVELLQPGEGRCEPRCPVFGRCGGCHWQHLSYETQRQWKERLFSEILHRQLRCTDLPILPILPANQAWNYRSRVQFKCHVTKKGFSIGFFRRGSHFVESIQSCPIAADPVNQALGWLQEILPDVGKNVRVPQVDVSMGDEGRVRVVVHDPAAILCSRGATLGQAAEKADLSLFLQTGKNGCLQKLGGKETLDILVDDPPLWLGYGPGGFAQVHLEQNRRLVRAALDLVDLTGDERVLDLFCGMGNLSLPLARKAAWVDGVEAFAPSISQARINAVRNGVANVGFFAGDAGEFLARTTQSYDLVVLDPPRGGAKDLLPALLHHAPRRILYISCDPMTLARDLKVLLGGGYHLAAARAADLFPQTYHLECITLLERA